MVPDWQMGMKIFTSRKQEAADHSVAAPDVDHAGAIRHGEFRAWDQQSAAMDRELGERCVPGLQSVGGERWTIVSQYRLGGRGEVGMDVPVLSWVVPRFQMIFAGSQT